MLGLNIIPVELKVNSNASINLNIALYEHDNMAGTFRFKIFNNDQTEIDYSEIVEAIYVSRYPDNTMIEPVFCRINSDSLEVDIVAGMLCLSGTVTGALRLFSSDEQILTTSLFRFAVQEDMFPCDGVDHHDEHISFVNQMIEELSQLEINYQQSLLVMQAQMQETQLAEQGRVSAEAVRVDQENTRQANSIARQTEWTALKAQVASDVDAEIARVDSALDTAIEEYDEMMGNAGFMMSYVNVMMDTVSNAVEGMSYTFLANIDSLSVGSYNKLVLVVPLGYVYTIKDITIISNGTATGIDNTNTSTIRLVEGADTIGTKTFNASNPFPSLNNSVSIPITDGLIDKSRNVVLEIVNGTTAVTPKFSLQISYSSTLEES